MAHFEIEVEKAEDSLPGVDEASEVIADLDRIAIATLRNQPAPSYQVTTLGAYAWESDSLSHFSKFGKV